MKKVLSFIILLVSLFPALGQVPCIDGFVADTWNCENVDMWRFLPIDEIGGGNNVSDCWGWTDSHSQREFAIVGKNNGTAFIEITNPGMPVYLGTLPTHTTNILWRDIKTIGKYAYIVSEAGDHGLQIFDMTQLLDLTEFPVALEETVYFDDFGNSHNIVANENSGYVYSVGGAPYNGGLHAIDVSDPLNPETAGGFDANYTHDAQVVQYIGPDADYSGKEIAFCFNGSGIKIVDVSQKDDMTEISNYNYDDTGYTHQGWLSHDMKFVFFNDETDETTYDHNTWTYILNVEDLDEPELVGIYEADNTAIDHNLYTEGNLIYASNYRSGLRIIDFGDVENGNLYERGFFDVSPSDDDPGYSGSWSNYPYFPSGSVIATDINDGFFILRPAILSLSEGTMEIDCGVEEYSVDLEIATELSGSGFTLSQTGLPEGVTISSTEITAPGTATITLGNLTLVPEGDHFFEIVVSSEDYGFYIVEGHILSSQDPGPTNLVNPTEGFLVDDLSFMFVWDSYPEASSYILQIATDIDFTSIVFSEETTLTQMMVPDILTDGDYYWRVGTVGDCGNGIFTDGRMFSALNIGVDELFDRGIFIYPNPVSDVLNIKGVEIGTIIQIMDVTGRIVAENMMSGSDNLAFEMNSFESGIYFVSDSQRSFSKRIIKK